MSMPLGQKQSNSATMALRVKCKAVAMPPLQLREVWLSKGSGDSTRHCKLPKKQEIN